MKIILLFVLLYSCCISDAQVGIGTTTPNKNAALDITSPNKGLLLPRLNDTGLVTSPSAGLMIYNVKSKTPAFHNGTNWKTLLTTADAVTDSITYTITNAPSGYTNGTFRIASMSNGIGNPNGGIASFSDITFTKMPDINSTGFIKSVSQGAAPGNSAFAIEFTFYHPGSATPYYSIKGTNIAVTSYQMSGGGNSIAESISIAPVIYGYKNWESGMSFAWNTTSRVSVPY